MQLDWLCQGGIPDEQVRESLVFSSEDLRAMLIVVTNEDHTLLASSCVQALLEAVSSYVSKEYGDLGLGIALLESQGVLQGDSAANPAAELFCGSHTLDHGDGF
jgi:hypothetical protein